MSPRPNDEEVEVAEIVSVYFKASVSFLVPRNSYKQKTPDITMAGTDWEIKTLHGSSLKTTVRKLIKTGSRQSDSLIVNGLYTKIDDSTVLSKIRSELRKNSRIKRLLYITKEKKVIEVLFKK